MADDSRPPDPLAAIDFPDAPWLRPDTDDPRPPDESMKAALAPFGWTCTEEFWQRYYTDAWVFHLANAVERLTEELGTLRDSARKAT